MSAPPHQDPRRAVIATGVAGAATLPSASGAEAAGARYFRHGVASGDPMHTGFVTGDIHSAWAAELPYGVGAYPVAGDTAGVELVCSSVTSTNLKDELGTPSRSTPNQLGQSIILANNRHLKYLNFDDHGFSVLDLTPTRAEMDWFIIGSRIDRRTPTRGTKSFATKTGTGKLSPADGPVR